jgi:uncharacterized protein YcnI
MRASIMLATFAAIALPAAPAAAHVGIAPDAAAPASFAMYTFTVPNERAAEDTTGLDVTLPAGFTLEDAEALPGWRMVVDTRPDGTASAVHWSGGRIPPRAFGRFAVRGRTGDAAGPLVFPAVQHYRTGVENWTGPADSEHPAPRITVGAATAGTRQAPGGTTAPATAPAAVATTSQAVGADDLARSRAALALMLAIVALVVLVAGFGLRALRRVVLRAPGGVTGEPTTLDHRTSARPAAPSTTSAQRGAVATRKMPRQRTGRS